MSPFRSTPLLLCMACTGWIWAAEFQITIKNSEQLAKHVPIRTPVSIDVDDVAAVSLSGDGHNLVGQLSRTGVLSEDPGVEVTFVVPVLEPNEEIRLIGKTIRSEETRSQFRFHDERGKYRELKFGDRPVLRYMYEAIDRSTPQRLGGNVQSFPPRVRSIRFALRDEGPWRTVSPPSWSVLWFQSN